MVLATHEMGFARDVATQVCFLDGGRILEKGPPEQMFTAPREERTRQFLRRVLQSSSPTRVVESLWSSSRHSCRHAVSITTGNSAGRP